MNRLSVDAPIRYSPRTGSCRTWPNLWRRSTGRPSSSDSCKSFDDQAARAQRGVGLRQLCWLVN